MRIKQGRYNFKNLLAGNFLKIWLGLISLTLLNLLIVELHDPTIGTTIIVCMVVLLKSRLVIEHFMGLKHAAVLTRWIIYSYVCLLTFAVGFSIAYSQYLLNVDLF